MAAMPKPKPSSAQDAVHIQGGWRTSDPDGGYTVRAKSGTTIRHPPDGNIEGQLPLIRMMTVADISKATRHDIAHVYDTTSHTLHFVGGGTLSYMHARNDSGYEISGHNVDLHVTPHGVVIVFGSASEADEQRSEGKNDGG
ncbi:hypothetical protein [Ralstonia sp.]|uniref:hypothetical protein n=1 Tax=Ralstonia sp. TaxID=54061 RepID=UPI002CF604CF|nr:hypothetical protein [Ralstonia sp.]HWV02914.1 hypothetical protein [Ralstonia sp.]